MSTVSTTRTAALLVCAALATPAFAITWGEPDETHANAGALVFVHPSFPELGRVPICSGFLVDEQVFVTAGHCTAFVEFLLETGAITIDEVFVTFNPDPFVVEDHREAMDVASRFELARPLERGHDIGALILAEPVADIEPVTLAPVGFFDVKTQHELVHGEFIAVGYGATIMFPPPDVNAIDLAERQRRFAMPRYEVVHENYVQLQQNGRAGNSGICYGDSGGPIFWKDPDTGEESVVALITNVWPADCQTQGLHYRTDIPAARDFIDAATANGPDGAGAALVQDAPFLRGDLNADGLVDISDPIRGLGFLFLGSAPPRCADSADANDDGDIDVSDPVFLLSHLFAGGRPPAAPYPEPGPDATGDALGCTAGR